jgi:Ca-activated chloride channel family protein
LSPVSKVKVLQKNPVGYLHFFALCFFLVPLNFKPESNGWPDRPQTTEGRKIMQNNQLRSLVLVACLIAVTCTAMAYTKKSNTLIPIPTQQVQASNGVVKVNAHLTQSKVVAGTNGNFAMELNLTADDVIGQYEENTRNVDMVVVLDRSGSMQGQKIQYARQAVHNLLAMLTPQDRLALISYADGVQKHANLLLATETNKMLLSNAIQEIAAGGGTNLGGGLQTGIEVLTTDKKNTGNLGRVILISDGLANQGITDPRALAALASTAVKNEFSVSTVGVGNDYNEYLMTAIADQGTGRYYYLENPNAFAKVFQKEFFNTRIAAATKVEVKIPLAAGVTLIEAAGYPFEIKNNVATFRPGDLLSGQSRKLFLSFRLDTDKEQSYSIQATSVSYQHQGQSYEAVLNEPLQIACVKDPRQAFASIDKGVWEQKVLQDDYNRLKEQVAQSIKAGDKKDALEKIEEYQAEQEAVNSVVGSSQVEQNLKTDLDTLRSRVEHVFSGAPAAVAAKQKKNAKAMQYQAYEGRRATK